MLDIARDVRGDVEDARTKDPATLYRQTEETEGDAVDGPASVNQSDPLSRCKATLIALSRSDGPGIGNGGRSVVSRSSPSHLWLSIT